MLWLLRHAQAAPGTPDAARPLTEKGREDARAAGLALERLGVRLDACLTSPKVRAVQTAELACAALELQPQTAAALADAHYDPEVLAAGHGDTMLVGHNPSISIALQDLTGAHSSLKKGGVAAIEEGELVLLLGPRELRALASGGDA
jgi:phosphohistidine phosphatase